MLKLGVFFISALFNITEDQKRNIYIPVLKILTYTYTSILNLSKLIFNLFHNFTNECHLNIFLLSKATTYRHKQTSTMIVHLNKPIQILPLHGGSFNTRDWSSCL